MNRKFGLLLCFLMAPWFYSVSQDLDTRLWLDYNLQVPTRGRLTYGGDIGYRQLITERSFRQFIFRPTATYGFNEIFGVAGGLAWFNTYNREAANLDEFRIQQDVNLRWPDFGFARLFFRTRLEQRFFFYPELPDEFSLRARFLGGMQTRDLRVSEALGSVYFSFMYEGFANVGNARVADLFVNSTRAYYTLGHRLTKTWRYEVQYIREASRLSLGEDLQVNLDVIRLRVFHTLFEKEKERSDSDDPQME